MSIGQNTYWLVVDIDTGKALCPKNDQRAALKFTRESAAKSWADVENAANRFGAFRYMVVEVPA